MFYAVNGHRNSIQVAYEHNDFHRISSLENLLDKAMEDEEIYWKQRSKKNLLGWGDKNTKWFHKKASMRKCRNTIHDIYDSNGVWLEEHNKMMKVFIEYFQQLFQSSNPNYQDDIERGIQNIPRCVTQ